MDDVIALAPAGIVQDYISLILPMVAAGLGLGLVGWIVRGAWGSVLALFEV